MKSKIGLLIVFLLVMGCAPKKIVSVKNECKVLVFPEEDLTSNYKAFNAYSDFYRNQFIDFDKIKNGILLYRWQEGSGSSVFLIANFDDGFHASERRENFIRIKTFSLEDKKNLDIISKTLEKGNYYQSCLVDRGHSSLYILVIRCNNQKKVQYYSPMHSPYEIATSDNNIKLVQKVFEIMDTNFYK